MGYHLHHRTTDDLDLFTLDPDAFERGPHVIAAVASVVGGLVDVMALERAGYRVEDVLPHALAKDGGCTPANLAWLLSEIRIPDEAVLPGGIVGRDLAAFVRDLVARLRRAAMPGVT